jgi:hypothetical protein
VFARESDIHESNDDGKTIPCDVMTAMTAMIPKLIAEAKKHCISYIDKQKPALLN